MASEPGKPVRHAEEAILATKKIATIPNHFGSDIWVEIRFPWNPNELPEYMHRDITGFPDFAKVRIRYRPGEKLADLRVLKLYLLSFGYKYCSQERAFDRIFVRFLRDVEPVELVLEMRFNSRGNMGTRYRRRWEKGKHSLLQVSGPSQEARS